MITLRTGLPGASKTLFALYDYVVSPPDGKASMSVPLPDGTVVPRQIFVNGIPGLDLDRLPNVTILDEPSRWMDCPPGSIVVLDECQRLFRSRPPGAPVPDYVSSLETHRHMGVDLVLITQDPMLVDAHVRRLVGEHFHFKRTFGFNGATQYRWQECKSDPKDYHAKKEAEKTRRKFPKKIYSYYKSAEIHTVKRKIPLRMYVVMVLLLVIPFAGYFVYKKVSTIASSALGSKDVKKLSNNGVHFGAPVHLPPTVYQTNHPLAAFHANSLKVRVKELGDLPKISTRFRLVGSITLDGSKHFIATSASGHYVTLAATDCKNLDGLPVCKWGGGYVSINPVHPHQQQIPVNPVSNVQLPGSSSASHASGSIFP